MSTFHTVSEDISNRHQSWYFEGVYRSSSVVRVEIRANTYREQSHANVSVWGAGGWHFHTSIPTEEWYDDAPSYTAKRVEADFDIFYWLRDELLGRLALALWGASDPLTFKRAEPGEVVTYG